LDYIEAHIPGAIYVHLDKALSAPIVAGKTGRHPLPSPEYAAEFFANCGIGEKTQVVAYDAAGGAVAAVRAWWMLKWLGHEAVAVLDGGWQKWQREGRTVSSKMESRSSIKFKPQVRTDLSVDVASVQKMIDDPGSCLLDSRSADRYRGENETIDPVAGHIPGAVSAPYQDNLKPDGTFRSPEELRERFQSLIGETPVDEVVFYCGSGVTAIHNILAVAHAGLGMPKLYPGSWSEWITDPERPISTEQS
jgi:thiosulfate/3-mercaptopyruvate sulfurtransferase